MKTKITYLTVLLILASCNYSSQKKELQDGGKTLSKEIIFQLNWFNDPTFTGEYVAYEQYWKMKKLNVLLKEGGVGIDPIALVSVKKADYAVVGADKAIIAISNGAPISIISVDLQRNPVGWIARPELKINKIEDCYGRNDIELGDKAGTEISAILKLMLKRKNLKLNTAAVSFDFSYFLSNKNSIYPVYLNEEPFKARIIHKINVIEIDPSKDENGGIELYGNVIITHNDKIKDNYEEVFAIVNGLIEGWTHAITDNEKAVDIVLKYVKNDKDYVREVVKRTLFFVADMYGKSVPPGHMEKTAWENTIKTLKEAELLKVDVDINRAIKFIK